MSSPGQGRLAHHELCFGCGRVNLFGLLCELEATDERAVAGRCFIKQDHQGPDRACGHPGLVAAALLEAMWLAVGADARPLSLRVEFTGQAPVGDFLELAAGVQVAGAGQARTTARAGGHGHPVASAVGSFLGGPQLRPPDPPGAPGGG